MFLICHATTDAVRLDHGVFQHRNGFLDDDDVACIEESNRRLSLPWEQVGLFELSGFRQGYVDEVDRLCTSDEPRR